jgi:hypothetical protein
MPSPITTDAEPDDSGGGDIGGGIRRIGVSESEMSPEDRAIFDKHFGGDDDDDSDDEPPAKPAPKAAKDKTPPAKDPKAKDGKTPDAKTPAKVAPKAQPEVEEDEPEDDGEAPEVKASKKARELFKQAEESKDQLASRRLYKQAMKEAFGKVPDAFNDARFAAGRQAEQKRSEEWAAKDRELEQKRTNVEASAQKWVEQLKPAYEMHQVMQKVAGGDWTALGDLIEKCCPGVTRDEALKRFTRGMREAPDVVAARRAAAQRTEVESASMKRIAELEKRLEEKDQARERQQHEEKRQAALAKFTAEKTEELADHPVSKLPGGIKAVVRLLIKTADPKLRAPTKTPEEAADLIVAHERRRVRAAAHLLEDQPTGAPALRGTERVPAVARSQSTEPGSKGAWDPDEALDRIYAKHKPAKGRRR